MDYREKLIETYYFSCYQHFIPQTVERWDWKVNRIDLNFGNIFSSIPKDRLGHVRRYAINCDKIKNKKSWKQLYNFEDSLEKTIKWYLDTQDWVDNELILSVVPVKLYKYIFSSKPSIAIRIW